MPQAPVRSDRVLASDRLAVLGSLRRVSVRPLLLGLERAEPAALPQPAVRCEEVAPSRLRTTRACTPQRTRGSSSEIRAPRSRSAKRPRAGATSRRACARPTRPASSPSSWRRRTPASSSTRGHTIRTPSTRTPRRRNASSGRTCRSHRSQSSTRTSRSGSSASRFRSGSPSTAIRRSRRIRSASRTRSRRRTSSNRCR